MPFPALLLLIAALLPLVAFVLLLFLGRRMGTPLSGYVATAFIAGSFLCSGWAMLRWIGGGNYHGLPFGKESAPINMTVRWLPLGLPGQSHAVQQDHPGYLDVGLYIDSLTVSMFVTITLAAMLVHLFAVRSLRRDPRFPRLFTCFSLTLFATLGAVLSASLLHVFLLLGVLSFCTAALIGFRLDNDAAARAAVRSFIFSRLGDAGMIVGLAVFLAQIGNLNWADLWLVLGGLSRGLPISIGSSGTINPSIFTFAEVALFFGIASRCWQFPFQTFAADPADGVATVAAMVYSVSQSVVGIYVVGRLYPILTPSARLWIAMVGVITLIAAAMLAVVQTDVKKVLAHVAAGQIGFTLLGIGVGDWTGGLFALIAYIYFQTLLFLAAGGVIRAARGKTDIRRYGGLIWRMPATAVASAVGVVAACALGYRGVGLSGYYGHRLILHHAGALAVLASGAGRSAAYWGLIIVPAAATSIIAFALGRWWLLTFAGEPRDQHVYKHAMEAPTLYWPLVMLAIMTVLAGKWLGVRDMLESSIIEARQAAASQAAADISFRNIPIHVFDTTWPDQDQSEYEGPMIVPPTVADAVEKETRVADRTLGGAGLLGIALSMLVYARGLRAATRLAGKRPVQWIHHWLIHGMYFGEMYEIVVRLLTGAARLTARLDKALFSLGPRPRPGSSERTRMAAPRQN